MEGIVTIPLLGRQYQAVYWLSQRRRGDRQVTVAQLEAHHRQPAPRIVASDHLVRHTDLTWGS
jgi:hypothetical protein